MSMWIYSLIVISSAIQLVLFFISSPLPLLANAIACATVIYASYRLIKKVDKEDLPKIDGPFVLIMLGFILVGLSFYKGVFTGSFYNGDWPKHRAILFSIFNNPMCPKMDGFDLSQINNLSELRLNYYYAPYYFSALTGKIMSYFFEVNPIQLMKWITNIFLVQQLVLICCALPVIFRGLADFFGINKNWNVFLIFSFYFLIWSGADFWWAKYIFSNPVPLGEHMDGLYNKVFPAQIHSTASLMIWVSGQIAAVASGLAIIIPFKKYLHWPSLVLGFATVFAGSTLSIYILGLFLLLFCLKYSWLSKPNTNMALKLGLCLMPVFYFGWYYSQRMAPDALILNPALKTDFTGYLSFVFREFLLVFILIAMACWLKLLRTYQAGLILLFLLLPTPFYLGSYNGLMLKAYIGVSFLGAILITAIGCQLARPKRLLLHFICTTLMLPLFINEHIYSNRVNTIYLEGRFPIVIQYASKAKQCIF